MGEVIIFPPEPLADHHDISKFSCGQASLDHWLRRRARANQQSGATRTFVVCEEMRVIGYYGLASGMVMEESAPEKFKKGMPKRIPVSLLARLAVDQRWQRRGIGRGMFRDAARRVEQAADAIGIRGIVVHAISEQAKKFYLALGFEPSPTEPLTLMVTLADIRAALP